jgi:xanthine dehydrogenase accessory factor
MKEILTVLKNELENGRDTMFVSVTASSGATPREAGARMVVGQSGRLAGTIGGGAVELRSEQFAREQLLEKTSASRDFVLTRSDVEDLGMICGGDVTVHFLYLAGGHTPYIDAIETALSRLERLHEITLVVGQAEGSVFAVFTGDETEGELCGLDASLISAAIAAMGANQQMIEIAGISLYAEKLGNEGRIVIFGGGHVGQAVATLSSFLKYPVVVLDDRREFLQKDRYPADVDLSDVDFDDISKSIAIRSNDFVCIMTRGHRYDQIVEAQILKTDARYIGVIGSRVKAKTVAENLRAEGFTDEDLARITTPIGLSIGAETPEEIAISILAEIIEVRSKGR